MSGKPTEKIKECWAFLKKSPRYHDMWLFLLFILIAAVFWFVMVLNDSVEETFTVKLNIYNKPDSVTFINDPPSQISVTIRDKGTQLLRGGFSKQRDVDINFREFAEGGVLRCSNKDFYRLLRGAFGTSSQILSATSDSLRLAYTSLPGKRVPIELVADVNASLGNTLAGKPELSRRYALVYAENTAVLDTIYRVFTQRLVKKNLKETTRIDVKLAEIKGVKIVPASVTVNIPVEALVNKTAAVPIIARNVPFGSNVVLFPSSVDATFYIPMSKFNTEKFDITVEADFHNVRAGLSKVPVRVAGSPDYVHNIKLMTDSVEFTLVKNN